MDRYLKSLSGAKAKNFDRNHKDYYGPSSRKGGRYVGGDKRQRGFYRQGDSHSKNRFNQKNTLAEIRRLLKEIIISQQTTLSLLDENRTFDRRIAAALEIIAAKTR